MENNIVYDIRWSNQCDETFIKDYLDVCTAVFNSRFTRDMFMRKFVDNIYGPSVIVVVYIDGIPSAARALWRNDIDGKEAYQPGDTCVLEKCRGKGVFSAMTMKSVAFLPETAIIYNFPNPNSYSGYIKMGWKLVHDYYNTLFTNYDDYVDEHPIKMDNQYADWWICNFVLFYAKKGNHFFLVNKDHRPFCYRIFAEVDEIVARRYPRAGIGLFFYKSAKKRWYNKHFIPSHVVTRNPEIEYIPVWKVDAV